jgi:biopolymer transport protein ExbB/TolQ
MIKKYQTPLLFFGGMALAAAAYAAIWRFAPPVVVAFFYSRGFTQPLSTVLFTLGLLMLATRQHGLSTEMGGLSVGSPPNPIGPQEALALAERIATNDRHSVAGRRLAELLRGYARGSDIQSLIDRLAEKSREELERGNTMFGFVKAVLPLLGLVGTVLGLSQGMLLFGRLGAGVQQVEKLRKLLGDFADSLSTAFDTTLVALGYMLILWVISLFVDKKEQDLLERVNLFLEEAAARFKCVSHLGEESRQHLQTLAVEFRQALKAGMAEVAAHVLLVFRNELQNGMAEAQKGWIERWRVGLAGASRQILEAASAEQRRVQEEITRALKEQMGLVLGKLEALERAISRPKPLQIQIVGNHADEKGAAHEIHGN